MDDQYWEKFVDYAKRSRKLANYKFQLNMEEIQSVNARFIPLDATKDPLLPDWAKRILFEKHLSKRTKLLLMQYHDNKIRACRMKDATPQQQTQTQGETYDETEYDEDGE